MRDESLLNKYDCIDFIKLRKKYSSLNFVIEEINLEVRKVIYGYKGAISLEYISSLTIEQIFKEIRYLNDIIKEENKAYGSK